MGVQPCEDKVGGGGWSKLSRQLMSGAGGDPFTKPVVGALMLGTSRN